ncbi:MAG: type IX secretion system PorP/SprF family membrane protein [Arenicella sp.]|jgi:type IX secretion system PorP/SprF family membrane protein
MKRLLLSIAIAGALSSFGQDIHFTQMQQTPMLLNPAYTGMFNGWERIAVSHKSQWVSAGTKYQTTSIAADLNLFKPKQGNTAYMGTGIQLYNDIGGDSRFGTKQMLLNVSGVVPIGEMHSLSAGLQIGLGQRTGDLSKLVFGNQFNETENEFDTSFPSNETNGLVSFVYPDVGFGAAYRFGKQNVDIVRDDQTEFIFGFAYTHANKPDLKYRLGFKEELYAKVGVNASFLKDFQGSKAGIELYFNQFVQGPHSETMFGFLTRYRISSGSKSTGLTRDTYLKGGLYYRLNDAIAPALFVHMYGFDFGVSYDITLSKLGQVKRGGGLEFSLVYSNLDFALFKRRGN